MFSFNEAVATSFNGVALSVFRCARRPGSGARAVNQTASYA
jgi:hypothetical protein